MWGSFGIAGMTLAYFMAYIGYYVVGYYQLMARSQRSARTATILFRLQVVWVLVASTCVP